MLSSTATLTAAQSTRAATLPARIAEAPLRSVLLEGVRQRNTVLDALFYDVSVVTAAEVAAIARSLAAEGAILIVPPSGDDALTLCTSIEDFARRGAGITTLAVAGVGSSALGSAAFGRNIADAIGEPVAVVVSGYGLSDVAAEALGGFFWFGMLNRLRHIFEPLDRLTEAGVITEPLPGTTSIARESRDTRTVVALLEHADLRFDLLLGHSKGNLVVSEALYDIRRRDAKRLAGIAERTRIVTISARIAMPRQFGTVIDIMGAWDWFGEINSRHIIRPDELVPNAWHHTNTELPAHLPVTETVRRVLARASRKAAAAA